MRGECSPGASRGDSRGTDAPATQTVESRVGLRRWRGGCSHACTRTHREQMQPERTRERLHALVERLITRVSLPVAWCWSVRVCACVCVCVRVCVRVRVCACVSDGVRIFANTVLPDRCLLGAGTTLSSTSRRGVTGCGGTSSSKGRGAWLGELSSRFGSWQSSTRGQQLASSRLGGCCCREYLCHAYGTGRFAALAANTTYAKGHVW